MANHYTQFSVLLDVGSADKVDRAFAIYRGVEEASEFGNVGFICEVYAGTTLCLYSEESGDVEALIEFVKRCGRELPLFGLWGFEYADTCSKMRPGEFGGGAHVLDLSNGETVAWVNSHDWLAHRLASVVDSSDCDFADFDGGADSTYEVSAWQAEVANGDTRLGYFEWVGHCRERDACTCDAGGSAGCPAHDPAVK